MCVCVELSLPVETHQEGLDEMPNSEPGINRFLYSCFYKVNLSIPTWAP
jgi:hypothetical protein